MINFDDAPKEIIKNIIEIGPQIPDHWYRIL